MKAKGIPIGDSISEDPKTIAHLDLTKIHLPLDLVIADAKDNSRIVSASEAIPSGWEGVDIGPKTIEAWSHELRKAQTIFWNGPLGVFEKPPFAKGTQAIAETLAEAKAITIIGWGDSVAAIQLNRKMLKLFFCLKNNFVGIECFLSLSRRKFMTHYLAVGGLGLGGAAIGFAFGGLTGAAILGQAAAGAGLKAFGAKAVEEMVKDVGTQALKGVADVANYTLVGGTVIGCWWLMSKSANDACLANPEHTSCSALKYANLVFVTIESTALCLLTYRALHKMKNQFPGDLKPSSCESKSHTEKKGSPSIVDRILQKGSSLASASTGSSSIKKPQDIGDKISPVPPPTPTASMTAAPTRNQKKKSYAVEEDDSTILGEIIRRGRSLVRASTGSGSIRK